MRELKRLPWGILEHEHDLEQWRAAQVALRLQPVHQHLEGQVDIVSGPEGTSVSITHATFISRLPTAA